MNRGEVTTGRERPSWFGKRKISLCQGFDNTAGPKVRAKSWIPTGRGHEGNHTWPAH